MLEHGSGEKFLHRVRLAAAGKASEVNELNSFAFGIIDVVVKSQKGFTSFVWFMRVDIYEHSVKAIFHVGNQVLGAAEVGNIVVNALKWKKLAGASSEAQGGVSQIARFGTGKVGGRAFWEEEMSRFAG